MAKEFVAKNTTAVLAIASIAASWQPRFGIYMSWLCVWRARWIWYQTISTN